MRFAVLACIAAAAAVVGSAMSARAQTVPVMTVPPASPRPLPSILAPVTQPEGLGFGDPGPNVIDRATTVPPARYPVLPSIPNAVIAPNADELSHAQTLVGVRGPFVGFTLADAVTMALVRNSNLAVSQANRRIARYRIVADEGAYDVRFQLQPSYLHSVTPADSPLMTGPQGAPITQDILGVSSTFAGLLPSGTRYGVTLSGQRVTTDSAASGYNPYYPTRAGIAIDQPLGQNRRIDPARRQELNDRITLDIQTDQTLVEAQRTIESVADNYWSLVYAWQSVALREAALRQAQLQAESNARRVREGRVAASDVVEANVQVSIYQSQVSLALQTVQQQQLTLKSLVLTDTSDPIWTANLVPITAPEPTAPEPVLESALAQALHLRPELDALRDQRRAAGLQVAYAADQLKPQVDVGVAFAEDGFAGAPNALSNSPLLYGFAQQTATINALVGTLDPTLEPGARIAPLPMTSLTIPPYQNGTFGSSVKSLLAGRYPTVAVALTLGLPLRNRTARGTFDAATEQDRSLQVQQLALVKSISSDVETALEMLRSDTAIVASSRDARQAAQAVYESEVRRRIVGRSTTFLVLQRLGMLVDARGGELQAQSNYNRALAFYRQATGELLQRTGFDVRRAGTATLDATSGPAKQTHVADP